MVRPCAGRSTDLDHDRTHNKVNETTDIDETTGPAWVTPVHDRAGNMTTARDRSSLTNGLTCKCDAWDRLVGADPPDPTPTEVYGPEFTEPSPARPTFPCGSWSLAAVASSA